MKTLTVDFSGLRPLGLGPELAHDEVVDALLAGINHGLANFGIRAELSTTALAGDDVIVIWRPVAVVSDGGSAIPAR